MRVILLAKAQGDFKHSGKYYLLNGRWHKLHQDKPAPKGAPVSNHPHAAGQHAPAKHFTDDEWNQLKLPDSNVNAGTFNKQLEQLKQHSEAGHVTGILGSGYGVNTYGKKLSTIANHLLKLHGSEHTVTPGQKAGEHHAVQSAPAEPAPANQPDATPPIEAAAEPKKAPKPAKPKAEKPADPPSAEPVTAPVKAEASTGLSMPEFEEGKEAKGVKIYYEKQAQKVMAMVEAGDVDGIHQMMVNGMIPKPNGKISNTWAGKTANSKKFIQFVLDAKNQLKAKSEPAKPEPTAQTPEPAPSAAPAPAATGFDFDSHKLPDSNANAKSHNGKIEHLKKLHASGDVAGLESFKAGTNTYGKKQMKIAAAAAAHLKANAGKPAEPAAAPAELEQYDTSKLADAFKQAKAKAKEAEKPEKPIFSPGSAGAYFSNQVDDAMEAGELDKLDKLVAKFDGHTSDGYQGIADYAKKAIAYLVGGKADESGPQDGDTKPAADGGILVFHDGHWHKQEEPKAAEQEPAAAEQPPSGGLPDVPDFAGSGKPHLVATNIAKELKHIADNQGHAEMMSHITQHKNGNFSIKAAGYHFKHLSPNSITDSYKELHDYVANLISASATKAGKKPKAQKPKATAAPKAPSSAPVGGIEPMDSWQQTGPQGGSNPGGKFKDENGTEWYCKFPADEDTAKAEVLAAKLYALAGVSGQDAKLITKGGKVGIASKWVDVKKADPASLANTNGVISGFATDAWLGNWDVVGLGYDNLQVGADGKAIRVDAGGSLMYRAQGGKKAFGDTVPELDSLIDPAINPQSAKVFGKINEADLLASVSKVVNLSDSKITAAVMTSGYGSMEDRQKLAATLIARKKYLAEKFPKAVKEKKIVFKPEDISQPPDFLNWGGTGKSGPSSKEFLNQANHQAAQDIYAAAKTGSIEGVKSLKSPIYNKDTGEVTGSAHVLEHPSQHIKGYAQQVINEINFQMNPPKKFRFDGGHPLHALNDSYPPFTGPLQADKVSKVGKFVALGDPGTFAQDDLGLPKITHKSGQLTQQTYAKQAQAAIAKMPTTQRQAVQAYTGSGYHSINSSLWNGNPSGQAKAAAEALHTLAHDIAPGTLLSRKISVSGSDLNSILGSTGKILQEPAIMSTSIRPSSWGGNVQLKMTVGPGVKGLWVGYGSMPGGGALSNHASEDEMILPPNTRLMILSVKKSAGTDADGFGGGVQHVIEAIILPSEGY